MMEVFTPPRRPKILQSLLRSSVFLAGSIEMGQAINWQFIAEQQLSEHDVDIYNPRRSDWDASWEQTTDSPNFREQVEWELDMLEECSIIMMFFDGKTKSPITLMELGLFANSGKLIVCCPKGFYRKGNVDIVCERHNIPQADNLMEMIDMTIEMLKD